MFLHQLGDDLVLLDQLLLQLGDLQVFGVIGRVWRSVQPSVQTLFPPDRDLVDPEMDECRLT